MVLLQVPRDIPKRPLPLLLTFSFFILIHYHHHHQHILLLPLRCVPHLHTHLHFHFHLHHHRQSTSCLLSKVGQKHRRKSLFVRRNLTQPPSRPIYPQPQDAKRPLTSLSGIVERSQRPFSLSIAERSRPPRIYPLRNTNWPHIRHGAAISCLRTHYTIKPKSGSWHCLAGCHSD